MPLDELADPRGGQVGAFHGQGVPGTGDDLAVSVGHQRPSPGPYGGRIVQAAPGAEKQQGRGEHGAELVVGDAARAVLIYYLDLLFT
jgi:hypothetical protein